MELRKVTTSAEIKAKVDKQGENEYIKSPFPVDRHNCECTEQTVAIKKGADKKYITCPRTLEDGMKTYSITCGACGAQVAQVYAKSRKLLDWCDLHYVTETVEEDGVLHWHGCMAVNISPIDETLGFECTCGQDTRDFRANTTLPSKEKEKWIEETKKGREFGKANSKFKVKEIK